MDQTRRGPKRSETSRRAIYEATRELLHAEGYDRLSIDAIARRAGVGKQTIYRWWSSKAAVIVDAVLDGYIQPPPVPAPVGDDIAVSLTAWLLDFREQVGTPMGSALAYALTTAAAADGDAATLLYERFSGPLREQLRDRLRASTEIRGDADHLAAADAIIGALVFLLLSRRPADEQHVHGLLDVVLNGIREPGH